MVQMGAKCYANPGIRAPSRAEPARLGIAKSRRVRCAHLAADPVQAAAEQNACGADRLHVLGDLASRLAAMVLR